MRRRFNLLAIVDFVGCYFIVTRWGLCLSYIVIIIIIIMINFFIVGNKINDS